MKVFIGALAGAMLVIMPVGDAFAANGEGEGYVSAMGSYIDDDKQRGIDDGFNGGQLSLGYGMNDRWNIAAVLMSGGGDDLVDQTHIALGLDLHRVFRRDERFSPYLLIGLGTFNLQEEGASDQNGAMFSGGAGFLLDMFDSNIAFRGEYRRRAETASHGTMNEDMFSLGFHIPFGDAAPKWIDSDGDGVSDSMDRCPNTPSGAMVDSYGCEMDSDGDGVKDSSDQCPNTPAGVSVDARGCPLDSDGDGVTDDKDRCPNTPRGAPVDEDGCELDSDGDGVKDSADECPDTAEGVQVDIKGCEIKAEITLRGVNFQSNSDRLLPGATSVLDDAVATLAKNPTIEVEVAGHTDSDGAAEYNQSLSARRAQTVYDYLAAHGIAENRMSVRGYGESQPIADNTSAAGKAENRRVVLRITAR